MGGFGGAGLASELENLQRLEELERRQRLMSAAVGGSSSANAQQNAMDSSGGIRGSVLRDERMQQHMTRPSPAPEVHNPTSSAAASSSPKPKPPSPADQATMPPAPVATEGNKEELEKTPGSVIVPCRARGMPMDHNFKVSQGSRKHILVSPVSRPVSHGCSCFCFRLPILLFLKTSSTEKS